MHSSRIPVPLKKFPQSKSRFHFQYPKSRAIALEVAMLLDLANQGERAIDWQAAWLARRWGCLCPETVKGYFHVSSKRNACSSFGNHL